MFNYNILIFFIFGNCLSKIINMSNYKLLSNTPITKFCPPDLKNIYKIYEKHPDLPEITMCCATRISHNFLLTEKGCSKKFNPKYVTAQSCNKKILYQAHALFTPLFNNKYNGVLLIQIDELFVNNYKDSSIFYNNFFTENNNTLINWKKNQCNIYGISTQSNEKEIKYYKKWTTVSNNTVNVSTNCRQNSDDVKKWLCPERNHVQFCEEDIGCPMMCNNKLIGIASQRYNWRTWAMKMNCGNPDVETRYLYLNWEYVNWIKIIIGGVQITKSSN